MHNRKTMLLGSSWALGRFVLVFVKSVVLVPLILSFWTAKLYTFWVLLLAANALLAGVYDGYIRYVTNAYNLNYYNEPSKAERVLGSGIRFAIACSVILLALLAMAVGLFPRLAESVFGAGSADVAAYRLPLTLPVFIAGNIVLNLLRFFYALNDPQGKIWRNLRFEVLYSVAEIGVLVLSLIYLRDFYRVVIANAAVYIIAAVVFILSLRKKYPQLPAIARNGNIREGAVLFRSSLPFIGNNFAEKLATDSYTLLLSFFTWPALIIRQFASIRTVTNAGISGMNIFQTVTVPQIQEYEARKNRAALLQVCARLWLLAALLCGTLLIPCYPLLERIYQVWTKGKIMLDPLVFGLLFICLPAVLYGNVLLYYLKSVNETKAVLFVTILKLAVLFSLLVFLPHTAVTAVADLLIAEVTANVFVYPFVVAHRWQRDAGVHALPFFMQYLLPFLLIAGAVSYYLLQGFSIVIAGVAYPLLVGILLFLYRKSDVVKTALHIT